MLAPEVAVLRPVSLYAQALGLVRMASTALKLTTPGLQSPEPEGSLRWQVVPIIISGSANSSHAVSRVHEVGARSR